MEADIRTVEEVTIDGDNGSQYTVAVAEAASENYEAAVIRVKEHGLSRAFSEAFGTSPYRSPTDAPIVSAEVKYVAVGEAVDAYLSDDEDEDEDCTCGPDEACDQCGGSNRESVEVEFDEE